MNAAPVWRRVVTPGTTRDGSLFVTIELHDLRNPGIGGPELSITGVAGPKRNGDAQGSCGQCGDYLTEGCTPETGSGWDAEMVARLGEVWARWHLNGMTAGSPAQEQFLRDHPYDRERDGSDHYGWACKVLADAGLNPDPAHDGYRYGSAWLYEAVPVEVLDWLRGLPVAVRSHPWGDTDYTREGVPS
jgi:hypothetical protein